MRTNALKRIYPRIRKMNWDETRSRKLYNPGLIMEYCNLLIPLSAGYSDTVEIYRNGNSLMILTLNTDIEYVSLDEVDCLDGGIIGSVFLEGCHIAESIGNRWLQMKSETLMKRLSEYL